MEGKKISLFVRRAAAVIPGLFAGLALSAQSNIGEEVISETTSALSGLVSKVVTLLQVVMGLGAIVVLAMVIFKVYKGDREAAEKLAWWIAGLTVGFVLLSVVSNLIPSA